MFAWGKRAGICCTVCIMIVESFTLRCHIALNETGYWINPCGLCKKKATLLHVTLFCQLPPQQTRNWRLVLIGIDLHATCPKPFSKFGIGNTSAPKVYQVYPQDEPKTPISPISIESASNQVCLPKQLVFHLRWITFRPIFQSYWTVPKCIFCGRKETPQKRPSLSWPLSSEIWWQTYTKICSALYETIFNPSQNIVTKLGTKTRQPTVMFKTCVWFHMTRLYILKIVVVIIYYHFPCSR